jgi:hypothetical protein
VFVPITPIRVLDTRINAGLTGVFTSAQPRLLDVTGTIPIVQPGDLISTGAPVPDGATAIVANVTAVAPATEGFVSVRPGNITGNPTTSNLNTRTNIISPNLVTVEIPTSGTQTGHIQLWYQGLTPDATTHLLIDIVGYYQTGGTGPQGPTGPTGPTGPAGPPGDPGSSARQQRLVALTDGPAPASVKAQPALAMGADRIPIIAMLDDTNDDLVVARCIGTCTGVTPNAISTTGSVGWAPSIAIGTDGLAVIAHGAPAGTGVRVTHCSTVACAAGPTVLIDGAAGVSAPTKIAIGADGFPLIAYQLAGDVRVLHCGDVLCTPGLVTGTTFSTPVFDGTYISMTIGIDGLALITHQTGDGDLAVTHCSNVSCTSATTVIADATADLLGYFTSVTIGVNGMPIIAHQILTGSTLAGADLRITRCTTVTCSARTSTTVETAGNIGYHTSIAVGPDGIPVIAHRDDAAGRLKLSRCLDATCTGVESIAFDVPAGTGYSNSLIFDGLGMPIVAHVSGSDIRLTIFTVTGWGP